MAEDLCRLWVGWEAAARVERRELHTPRHKRADDHRDRGEAHEDAIGWDEREEHVVVERGSDGADRESLLTVWVAWSVLGSNLVQFPRHVEVEDVLRDAELHDQHDGEESDDAYPAPSSLCARARDTLEHMLLCWRQHLRSVSAPCMRRA